MNQLCVLSNFGLANTMRTGVMEGTSPFNWPAFSSYLWMQSGKKNCDGQPQISTWGIWWENSLVPFIWFIVLFQWLTPLVTTANKISKPETFHTNTNQFYSSSSPRSWQTQYQKCSSPGLINLLLELVTTEGAGANWWGVICQIEENHSIRCW